MRTVEFLVCMAMTARDYREVYILDNYYGAFTAPIDEHGTLAAVEELMCYSVTVENEIELALIRDGFRVALMYNDADCYDCEGRLYASRDYMINALDTIRANLDNGLDKFRAACAALRGM